MANGLQRGFTLIELLVVFAIMGTLTVTGVMSFFSYSNSQSFQSAVSDVSHALTTIRARAISQVKPSVCGSSAIEGYEFWYPVPGTYYRISVRCSGTYHVLSRTNLPNNVTFAVGSTTNATFFNNSTGIVPYSTTMIITGYGKSNTITVDSTGVVSVQ